VSFLGTIYGDCLVKWKDWEVTPILQYYWAFFSYTFVTQWDIDQSVHKNLKMELIDEMLIKNKIYVDILHNLNKNEAKLQSILKHLENNKGKFYLNPDIRSIFDDCLNVCKWFQSPKDNSICKQSILDVVINANAEDYNDNQLDQSSVLTEKNLSQTISQDFDINCNRGSISASANDIFNMGEDANFSDVLEGLKKKKAKKTNYFTRVFGQGM